MNSFTISKEIFIKANREAIFELLTTADQITKYYPYESVESDWQLGGKVLFRGSVDDREFIDYGVIEALSNPKEFGYRYWSDNHGTERVPENHHTISYRLKPRNGGTVIELTHGNVNSREYYLAMNSIWNSLLEGLKNYAEK